MNERRNNWFLLTGMALGLGLGLIYGLLISPVRYTNVAPRSLQENAQSGYREMIALAYRADGDLGRAQARLRLLGDENPAYTLGAQAQRTLAEAGDADTARALAQLAADYNKPLPRPQLTATPSLTVTLTPLPAPVQVLEKTETPDLPPTPVITFTPRATLRSLPTLAAPFDLRQREIVCNADLQEGLLQIEAVDATGEPVAGVQVQVTWSGG